MRSKIKDGRTTQTKEREREKEAETQKGLTAKRMNTKKETNTVKSSVGRRAERRVRPRGKKESEASLSLHFLQSSSVRSAPLPA